MKKIELWPPTKQSTAKVLKLLFLNECQLSTLKVRAIHNFLKKMFKIFINKSKFIDE